MTDVFASDPEHRLDNLSAGKFFRAYAAVRSLVYNDELADNPISDLRLMFGVTDMELAEQFGLRTSALIGRFVDVAALMPTTKSAKDGGQSPVG